MKIVWTKSLSPLSKLIRFITGEPVSHTAIVFDDKIVFQSNLLGVHLSWWASFKQSQTIVYELDFPLPLGDDDAEYQCITPVDGKWYDFGALLFMGVIEAANRYLGIKITSQTNLWASKNGFMCVELLRKPAEILGVKFSQPLELMTPYQTFEEIKAFWDKKFKVNGTI